MPKIDQKKRGRIPKVSREEALHSAMKLFWARGYSGTTMDDLQKAAGLQRGSLYSYFGSKEALFDEALALYQIEIVQARRERVRAAGSAKAGIECFFKMIIDHSVKNRDFPGCLNTNTATELAAVDPAIRDRARRGFDSWEAFWEEIVKRGQEEGDLSLAQDPRSLARLLIALNQGVNVMSRVNPDRAYLQRIVKTGLEVIAS